MRRTAPALLMTLISTAQAGAVYECKAARGFDTVPVYSDAPTRGEVGDCVVVWRSPGSAPSRSSAPRHIAPLIVSAAQRNNVPPPLLEALVATESAFSPTAVSPKGAMGLTQLMPATARELQVRRVFDPEENLNAGARHLARLLQAWQGNVPLALAAYNAGESAVIRYGNRVPPYRETIEYVRRVQAYMRKLDSEAKQGEPVLSGTGWR